MGLPASATLSVSGLLAFGTFASLAVKIVYELDGEGIDGKIKNFEKPWAMATVMFVGMTFCLPIAYIVEYRNKHAALEAATQSAISSSADGANDSISAPLLGGSDLNAHPPSLAKNLFQEIKEVILLAIPTFFDIVATVLMNVGYLSVTASVYQMLRGAEMLFAALFAVVFLKRSLNKYHYSGIACCITGIMLVGTSSLMSGEGSATHAVDPAQILFGMTLVVASQAVQAAQITFEDFFMADMAIHPLKIVGYEGLFGTVAMAFFLLPLVQRLPGTDGQGIHEDSHDTWHMIRNTPTIFHMLMLQSAACLLYNVSGMCVTGHLGAVFRTVLETTRTLFVWLIDLLLFYTPLGMGKLGESWSKYSWIQAAGFVVLVAGTVVYGRGDEKEVVKEILEGGYDADLVILADGSSDNIAALDGAAATRVGDGGAARWSIPERSEAEVASPMALGRSSSLKSSMNINAFGSMRSSTSRSLRLRMMPPPQGRQQYLIKAGPAGGWARASKVGFVVRDQHSGELVLYHADNPVPAAPEMTRITGRSLDEELFTNPSYRLAIFRRLKAPLSPQKIALIHNFIDLNNGAVILEQRHPSSVLMASSTKAFEHLECSDFVMMMLHLVGLVEPTQNPFEYVTSNPRGRLLAAPVAIKLKSNSAATRTPRTINSTTTINSTATVNSTTTRPPSTITATTIPTTSAQAEPQQTSHGQQSPPSAGSDHTTQLPVLDARLHDGSFSLPTATHKNESINTGDGYSGHDSSTRLETNPTSVVAHIQPLKLNLSETSAMKSQGTHRSAAPTTPKNTQDTRHWAANVCS